MKIKEMIVDLTPLLDVILILLFMVLASQSQASDEKIVALETQVAQLEMTQVPGTPSEQAWYRTFQESIGKLNIVFPSSLDGQPMYLILEDGSQVEKPETLDLFSWLHGQVTSMKEQTLLSNPIPKSDIKTLVRDTTKLERPLSIASDKLLIANGKDQDLVDYFALAQQEVIVFGDFEQIVAEADDLCGHVEEDGVYHYCKARGLI